MSDLFFRHEKISSSDYVSIVRHMYMFKTMIQLQNDTFFIEITDDGNVLYVGNGGISLEDMSNYMKSATVDSQLLLRYVKGFKDKDKDSRVNVLEVLQSLYDVVSLSIVGYEELCSAFSKTNIAPNFIYTKEFKSSYTSKKLKLITMCQELIKVLEKYDEEEMLVPYYDYRSDTVSYSIKHINKRALRFDTIPLYGNEVFDTLLPVVAFDGSYGISIKQVIENTNAVIQYLIRLFNEPVVGSYDVLKRDVLADDTLGYNKDIEYVSGYSTKQDTDEVKYCEVSSGFIRDCLEYLKDLKSVRLFVEAIDNHLNLLFRPISASFCTVASAIYGTIKLKYENVNNVYDTSKVSSVVDTLLKLTSVEGGLPHIHQSAYMYLIDGSYVYTDFVDNLEVMLYKTHKYMDSSTVKVELYKDNSIRVFGCGIDELYDMSDYIDLESIGGTVTLEELIDVIEFSLRVMKIFYHTWKNDDTVFVDAVNGLKMISSLQKEKLQFVSTYFNYSVDESLLFNTEMVGYFNDDLLMYGDTILPNSVRYEGDELKKLLYNVVKERALGLCVVLNSIAYEMYFNRKEYSKSSCITITPNAEFDTLYVDIDIDITDLHKRKIIIPKEYYHTVYALFRESDYSFENIKFKDIIRVLNTLKEAISNSSKFTGFYGVNGFTVLSNRLDVLNEYIDRSDTTDTNSVVNVDTMTKELAKTFIESGYDYISLYKGVMIVYSKEGDKSEVVPKSLYKFFYDTDKFNRVSLQQYIED